VRVQDLGIQIEHFLLGVQVFASQSMSGLQNCGTIVLVFYDPQCDGAVPLRFFPPIYFRKMGCGSTVKGWPGEYSYFPSEMKHDTNEGKIALANHMVRSSMFNVNFLTRCFNCFRVLTYTGWQYVYIQTRFVWQLDSVHVGAAHRMEQIWETRMVDCRQSFGLPHSCYGRVRKRCDENFFVFLPLRENR
jgi:hypothetical protein